MTFGLAPGLRNTMATDVLDAIDAGSGPAKLRIYNGSRPANGGTVTTLLAELTFSDPAGSVTGPVFTADDISRDNSADASGTATWFRIVDAAGVFVGDGDVSNLVGSGELKLVTTTIVATQPVEVSSLTFTVGNAGT